MEKKKPPKNKEFDIKRLKNELQKVAKHNCKHCYGRGYVGNRKGDEKRLVICLCALKKIWPEMAKRKKEQAEKNASKAGDKKEVHKKG